MATLTDAEADELARELDELRREVAGDLGEADAKYIRRMIAVQRGLEAAGRVALFGSSRRWLWWGGTACLTVAKVLENMEIGHNVMHGQWDWMGDPKIHSTTWEWDAAAPAYQWKHSHNVLHHTYTNVLGRDRDLGYGLIRMDPRQKWRPVYLLQPFYNLALAALFEYGTAWYDLAAQVEIGESSEEELRRQAGDILRKVGRQVAKDYVMFPALAGRNAPRVLLANLTANVLRSIWAHQVIFCGHFPGDVQVFEEEVLEGETRGRWYQRQLLGSVNIEGGPLLHVMTGNLSHQIEHHLFPDLPSNRYVRIAPQVREICARYGLPYHSGPLVRQVGRHWKRVVRMAFPGGR
ncbi:fatty acid desaturase family protein [Thermomonospora umbrina]|uniref:Linoleoyl-CoA desaturase n=1 Tax=Thermomonospora umbrina TaxID=111806 RepID=A0A3D9SUA9_9ACTN|nr:acyl-CoA desaturase [Thermomonospora umbrina]REE98080.1 linoleoyl-CoA desaturase [Thermomonospora umbrina]